MRAIRGRTGYGDNQAARARAIMAGGLGNRGRFWGFWPRLCAGFVHRPATHRQGPQRGRFETLPSFWPPSIWDLPDLACRSRPSHPRSTAAGCSQTGFARTRRTAREWAARAGDAGRRTVALGRHRRIHRSRPRTPRPAVSIPAARLDNGPARATLLNGAIEGNNTHLGEGRVDDKLEEGSTASPTR